jgi:N-acetyl-anhydromuramyl-L-alanine amidase AmpD
MVEIFKVQPLFAQQVGLLCDMNFVSSSNFSKRLSKIEAVVLYSTACISVAKVLEIFTKGHKVSAHYLLSLQREGKNGMVAFYNLVSDEHKAWHAGVSTFDCWEAPNANSVGIEIDNDGQDEQFDNARIAG